jgi:hypothetical protein
MNQNTTKEKNDFVKRHITRRYRKFGGERRVYKISSAPSLDFALTPFLDAGERPELMD